MAVIDVIRGAMTLIENPMLSGSESFKVTAAAGVQPLAKPDHDSAAKKNE